jgi:hypothetical protein
MRLPIAKSIFPSRLVKTGIRVEGCGLKSMVPIQIWLPSIVELLLGVGEKAVKLMIPTLKVHTVGTN